MTTANTEANDTDATVTNDATTQATAITHATTDTTATVSEAKAWLTTSDNPYNPFTQWDDWYNYDVSSGYNTCSYLARIVHGSNELSDADEEEAETSAINEIVDLNITGNYVKIYNTQ